MIEINLLPGAQSKAKQGGGINTAAFTNAIAEQLADRFLLGAIGAVIVAVAAIVGMYVYQSRAETAATEREVAAARDSSQFAAVLVARSHAETTRDSVYQQLAIIKSIDDSRFTWPHLLEEINYAVPPYTWLTQVLQTSALVTTAGSANDTSKVKADSTKRSSAKEEAKQKRAHADSLYNGSATTTTFRVVGQTVDIQALTLFMKNLEASPFIKNVQLTRSDLVTVDGKEVTEFQLEAESEVPPRSMIETVPLSLAVR